MEAHDQLEILPQPTVNGHLASLAAGLPGFADRFHYSRRRRGSKGRSRKDVLLSTASLSHLLATKHGTTHISTKQPGRQSHAVFQYTPPSLQASDIMATAIPPPTNNSKYFMNPHVSPPEPYYGNAAMPPQTPPSNSVSPTSYHSPIHVRQLRPQRTPLYIPAALRPTEKRGTDIPKRPQAPDTPPASNESSFDSAKSNTVGRVNVTFDPRLEEENQEQLQLRLSKSTSESLSSDLASVTGPPTTAHWKPDASATDCAVCHTTFTWFFRRHHCRHCGDVICDSHSRQTVPLDQNARFHPDGQASKSCDPCASDWKIVKRIRRSRASSIAESSNSSQGTAVPIPQAPRPLMEARVGSMARSEGGMVWSTF